MDLKNSLQYSPLDDGDMLTVHAQPASVIPDGTQTQNNVVIEKRYALCKSGFSAVESGIDSGPKQQKLGYQNQVRPKIDVKEIWVPRHNLKLVPADVECADHKPKHNIKEKTDKWPTKDGEVLTKTTKGPFSKSDLDLYRRPESASSDASSIRRNRSLAERLRGIGHSAGKVLQRAFSMEHIYRPQRKEIEDSVRTGTSFVSSPNETSNDTKRKGSLVLIKGVKLRMSKKGKKSTAMTNNSTYFRNSGSNNAWDEPGTINGKRHSHTWGQLLQQNLDGSQVIELSRATGKPFGFFVARGRVKDTRGIFVSRMQDENTCLRLAGLLQVGDEILEIEGADVRGADILEVNMLMANKQTLLLTVLPYVCRKDI